jgi:putative hydrolase of the HAD superfamily
MAALIRAYASPALVAPPAIDQGARAALEALAAEGVVLAVLSNTMRTPGEVVRQVLAQAGLLPFFKVLTFSDECRIRKPAPAIFHRTLADLGVPPEDAVHVGDDPILDVEGARDAGMRVIQATPDGRATAPVKPDAAIRHLGELPAAVGRLGTERR